jgi:hypothetical protein
MNEKNDRKERCKKRALNKRTKEAADARIANIEVTKIDSADIKLTVPFRLATKLNQETSLRKSQNNIRKLLSTYVENYFDRFVDDCNAIDDPALRARLFVEVAKLTIPRPKDFGDNAEDREKTIKRLFGLDT